VISRAEARFTGRAKNKPLRYPMPGWRGFWTHALPRWGLEREVNIWRLKNLWHVLPAFLKVSFAALVAKRCGVMTVYSRLSHRVIKSDGTVLDYGIASYKVVTTAFVNYLTDALQADQAFEDFKFHGWGTGTNAEAVGDTGLQTELTTEYATDSTRVTGTQTEGASANIYRTVATLDPDSGTTLAITEHGVFRANTGATTLMDRSKFSAINLVVADGDTLQSTYELTATAGG
jgi:hypothetical protein